MRSATLATVLVALVGASACSDSESEATVDVVVTAPPPGIDPMLARLRVSAEWLGGASTRSFERAATFDGDGLVTTVFRIRPERDAHTGTELYRFRAEGIADGRAIVSAQARLVFLAGRRLVLPLRLTQSCVDVECDEDSTCFDGSCVDDFVPACSLEGARGSDCTDAGLSRDASTMDAAPRDGEPSDAVSPDATPPLDAAPPMDVAPPTDVADLGVDADVDASGACSPATCVALDGCDTARCEGDTCVHASLCRADERCCGNVCAFDCAALSCLGMPAGTPCRGAAGPCDVVERCDGASPSCPPDGYASSDVPCRETPNACDETETCTGDGPACPMDLFAPAGAPCADGVCDGLGGCAPCTEGAACATGRACERGRVSCAAGRFECVSAGPVTAGTSCREAVGDCDVAESCDGVGLDCPTNRFEPSSTVCRAGGGCDRTERCTGTSADCPPDALEPATTVCRALVPGGCDVADRCTGTSPVCPPDVVRPNGTSCRTSTGVCDAPESCDGVLPTCPPDARRPAGYPCRDAEDDCDEIETCDGSSAACPPDLMVPAGVVCRESFGPCDVAETCDGDLPSCPADAFEPSTTVCRPANPTMLCDRPELCPGDDVFCPANMPAPAGIVCRPSTDFCDPGEVCSGGSYSCPSDVWLPNGTNCLTSCTMCECRDGISVHSGCGAGDAGAGDAMMPAG